MNTLAACLEISGETCLFMTLYCRCMFHPYFHILNAEKESNMIMPKSKGSGIMVSDFIDRNGYLR